MSEKEEDWTFNPLITLVSKSVLAGAQLSELVVIASDILAHLKGQDEEEALQAVLNRIQQRVRDAQNDLQAQSLNSSRLFSDASEDELPTQP